MANSMSDYAYESQRIIKKIKFVTKQRTFELLRSVAVKAYTDAIKNDKLYRDVTGNALNSTSIGLYYKGNLVLELHASDIVDQPTMKTLRKGQKYPLPQYYGSKDVGVTKDKKNKNVSAAFVGKVGKGGQWGPTLGPWFIHRYHPAKHDTWQMIVAIPVSYAKYRDKIVATMQAVFDNIGFYVREFASTRGDLRESRPKLPIEKLPGGIFSKFAGPGGGDWDPNPDD